MDNAFNFNAPQYVDFSTSLENEDQLESYFDIDHETKGLHIEEGIEIREEIIECTEVVELSADCVNESVGAGPVNTISSPDDDLQFYSPLPTPYHSYNLRSKQRRSLSVNDLSDLLSQVDQIKLDQEDDPEAKQEQTEQSTCQSETNLNKNKSKSKNNLQLARTKFGSVDHFLKNTECKLSQQKFISTAEAVQKFQLGTPIRFRSKPQGHQKTPRNQPDLRVFSTTAHSPKLQTKLRHRSPQVLSQQELEAKEIEEMKKHPVKANPLNKKILQNPAPLPSVTRKTPTKVAPFKFPNDPIKMKKTPLLTNNAVPKFHAKPMPNFVKGPVRPLPLPAAQKMKPTVPQTPKFSGRFAQRAKCRSTDNLSVKSDSSCNSSSSKPLTRTQVEPFSFDRRHQVLKERKEEQIKRVLDAEKKLREFHANPLPKLKSPSQPIKTTVAMRKRSSSVPRKSAVNDENKEPFIFRARPATVVHKKPFQVVKPGSHLIDVTEFHLNSERRAQEREEFERNLREKELEMAKLKLLKEEEDKKREMQAVKHFRKAAVHKANPVRKYKELPPHVSAPLTVPQSPNFVMGKRLFEKHLQD